MFNKTTIMGRICNDLNVHTTEKGDKVLSFKVAVDRKYQVKGAEKKVDFISVVAWRSTAEFIQRNFAKGRDDLYQFTHKLVL